MPIKKPISIDDYIAGFPKETKSVLEELRSIIKSVAPDGEEKISYNMPTFTLNGSYLVYFAGYKKHVSLYPVPPGSKSFEEEIATYRAGKGTAQFSLDHPLPVNLIIQFVKNSIQENMGQHRSK